MFLPEVPCMGGLVAVAVDVVGVLLRAGSFEQHQVLVFPLAAQAFEQGPAPTRIGRDAHAAFAYEVFEVCGRDAFLQVQADVVQAENRTG